MRCLKQVSGRFIGGLVCKRESNSSKNCWSGVTPKRSNLRFFFSMFYNSRIFLTELKQTVGSSGVNFKSLDTKIGTHKTCLETL